MKKKSLKQKTKTKNNKKKIKKQIYFIYRKNFLLKLNKKIH